ncbi:T9SS type A sorting domain-containing protein [Hymenobacter saemangeumensis]|uniref:T9SS type A sorting domain-containing protein n=1 Tax=Hymenobacter saemangeumensis TaxID=1084522 RepID=UPI003CD09BF0
MRASFRGRVLPARGAPIAPLRWELFPNPASGVVHLAKPTDGRTATVEVTDLHGRTLLTQSFTAHSTSWHVAGWPSGLYFIWVKDPTGATVPLMVGRLVVN